ncbi:MAG: branched-chain amino acid ABC transporter permease [Caldilineaceae bacterium]|nr:branched-chain amino acid ABC transporter permease [Caldilineaceae bacterium]
MLIVPLAVAAVLVATFGGVVLQRIFIVMLTNLILVVGLQLFSGNSGLLSFGHVAFVGIAAYGSILFSMTPQAKSLALRQLYPVLQNVHLPFLPSLLIGAAIATLLAAVVGFPLMRLSGAAAVIATLSLLVIAHTVFINWEEVTNGARTLFGVQQYTTLWNALAWALFFVLVAYWFKETATGLKLRASREEERAAAVMGVNIVRVRWVAWILSAFIVGVGGVLYAHFITSFSPVAFYLSQTFIIIAMLIIGGSGSVAGAVVGVVVVTLLTESLRAVENSVNMSQAVPFTVSGLSEMFVALAMILILIYRPAGIMRGREFVWPLWRARKEGDS